MRLSLLTSILFPYTTLFRSGAVLHGGLSRHRAAAQFGVGVSTVVNWVRRFHETGSVAPGQMGGHKPKAIRDGHRSEEHTSELQSHVNLVCRLLLEKKKAEGACRASSSFLGSRHRGLSIHRLSRRCACHSSASYTASSASRRIVFCRFCWCTAL